MFLWILDSSASQQVWPVQVWSLRAIRYLGSWHLVVYQQMIRAYLVQGIVRDVYYKENKTSINSNERQVETHSLD